MDEHGMENEHLEHRNSSNTEYLPTKCRVTKPPPPKPATNPLQFIKVAPPPLFQKAKEQVSKVEKIKKERKEVQDEAEDWQANLDNWKSSRRKLQEHIIERVVEVKKLEHEETGRNRRRSKTFNEILEERGKSKYSIPIYMDETNDWSDYGISDSRGDRNVDVRIGDQNGLGAGDQLSNEKFSTKTKDYSMTVEYGSNVLNQEAKLNNNDYNQDSVLKNGQYTYEGAIEGYRSRIKSKIDDSILGKISDIPKQNAEVLVPKGEIVKRKELFDRQLSTEGNHVSGGAAKRLQDFENSISIKQRLKSLERCNDQTVKLVDNINIVPKVKQISQLFDRPCTDNARPYSSEVGQNTNSDYAESREKVNINIVPWTERETVSESPEIFMYMDKHDAKENESQSDDKSSDTFYSGLEDNNYPPSISSTDYMALSSDREDSGIHTADVSCSVSQADDTAEELESNANSHETTNDDYHPRQKYFKDTEDNNNVYGDHILMLTKENVTNRTNIELQEDDVNSLYNSSTVSSFSKENIFDSTVKFLHVEKMDATEGLEAPIHHAAREAKEYHEEQIADTTGTSPEPTRLPEIREEIVKSSDAIKTIVPEVQTVSPLELFRVADSFPVELAGTDYVFDSDFPLLPTKMVEPPKVKPPPPPVVVDDDKLLDANIRRINSTKRIKNEITLKRSSFLGLSEPNDVGNDATEEVLIASPDEEYSRVEEMLAKQLYDSKISEYSVVENSKSELIVEIGESNRNWTSTPDEKIEKEVTNTSPPDEDEIAKREREIIEMVEKAEKFREPEIVAEDIPPLVQAPKPPLPLSRTSVPSTCTRKSADASYYDKQPDYLDDQDSEVLKVEQELQQLEQEELKRKRDNLLFRQACSRVFAKTKRYSLENIFDAPSSSSDCRKSMPELQCLKMEKELSSRTGDALRSLRDIDLKYRKSVPNIPGCLQQNYGRFPSNEFQTIERYERKTAPEFQHDVHRSAFEVPARRLGQYYEPIGGASAVNSHNRFIQPIEPPLNYAPSGGEVAFVKPRNRNAPNGPWLKTRPNIETKSYDQHWLYQEAELRRLQDQKSYSSWQQQPKYATDAALPSLIQRGPITAPHSSSITSVRKLTSVNTDHQSFMEHHHGPPGPPPSVTQPRTVAVEDGPNRILSVSGKKKCSFCGNELGRGAAMIIETLCLFYHMECFKCCVCHVQLGNGLNGTDVRVRNEKLHCHNCYSSDDGVKFSCV